MQRCCPTTARSLARRRPAARPQTARPRPPIQLMQRHSLSRAGESRIPRILDAPSRDELERDGGSLNLVNAGGTGSLSRIPPELRGATELAAGPGLLRAHAVRYLLTPLPDARRVLRIAGRAAHLPRRRSRCSAAATSPRAPPAPPTAHPARSYPMELEFHGDRGRRRGAVAAGRAGYRDAWISAIAWCSATPRPASSASALTACT